jgi:hypothetical protein
MDRRKSSSVISAIVDSGPDRIRTCNQGIMPTTSAFAANRAVVRGLDCAFAGDVFLTASPCPVSTPSRERAWLGVGMAYNGRKPQRSPSLRRYHVMLSQDATQCVVCCSPLTGRKRRFCSRTCKNKACYLCYEAQKQRGLERKRLLVQMLGGRCTLCGYSRCLAALSFHHNDPAQKELALEMRTLTNHRWEVLVAEVQKCTLLCLNCHAEVHHLQVPCSAVELPALQSKSDAVTLADIA